MTEKEACFSPFELFSTIFFRQNKDVLTPHELYAAWYNWRNQYFPNSCITYCSTSMTSGGFRLHPDKTKRENSFSLNASIAKELLRQIAQYFSDQNLLYIFPPDIGKKENWQEIDYLIFWMMVIGGVPKKAAEAINQILKTKAHPDFSNFQLSNKERSPYYQQLVRDFLQLTQSYPLQPVHSIVQLFDATSLGSSAEEMLARALGIPIKQLVMTNIEKIFPSAIHQDLKILIAAGARIPAGEIFPDSQNPIGFIRQLSF